jgi:hypothetical protein
MRPAARGRRRSECGSCPCGCGRGFTRSTTRYARAQTAPAPPVGYLLHTRTKRSAYRIRLARSVYLNALTQRLLHSTLPIIRMCVTRAATPVHLRPREWARARVLSRDNAFESGPRTAHAVSSTRFAPNTMHTVTDATLTVCGQERQHYVREREGARGGNKEGGKLC